MSLLTNFRRRRRRQWCDRLLFYYAVATHVMCTEILVANARLHLAQRQVMTTSQPSSSASSNSRSLSLRGGDNSARSQQSQSISKSQSNEKSPYEYIPITALNDYGQSIQLRHAMESASRYGTPILACLCCSDDSENENSKQQLVTENAIVICSLQRPRLGIVAPSISSGASSTNIKQYLSTSNGSVNVHPSIQGLVKVVATRDDVDDNDVHAYANDANDEPKHTLHTAIVCTGIQSDATFLTNQLQRHFSKFWFRYNTLPTSTLAVVKMIREVLLDCMGYDWSEEVSSAKVSGGVGSAAPSYSENDNDDSAVVAGRPLGVSSFLLSIDNGESRPTITAIEANGSSEQYVARAMGVGSQQANELLSRKWKQGMSQDDVKRMMHDILKGVAIERGWLSDDENRSDRQDNSDFTVVFETLTRRGINIEFEPLGKRMR